ncbi:cobalamin-dependent protein [Rhodobacteraceae bacterium N5(2021)]|uniref:Cobalamin-dependent protein n=1 Tax=Gymnodinialimonas phycosphaerae TaxID=2841589 RepID=A0A975TV71_9RHOB|nr:B12-binding domain-containing protein [Gymnodinialimonas phycosphaerae]MBY4894757.1 cobalamin-dependent protein [Gymnodinialimonas phycosphaerae]
MAKVVAESRDTAARQQTLGQTPSPHISELASALADTDHSVAEARIAELLKAGVGVPDLCLEHLAPAARELGERWERDALQFADVTMATARIQSILRSIPSTHKAKAGPSEGGALFAAVPGEAHTLGVIMAADHFRRMGWDVGLLIGMEHGELCRRIAKDDRTVIALSCAGRHSAPALHMLVEELRGLRPDIGIVLSGNVLNDKAVMQSLPRFDGVVDGLATAEKVLNGVAEAALVSG